MISAMTKTIILITIIITVELGSTQNITWQNQPTTTAASNIRANSTTTTAYHQYATGQPTDEFQLYVKGIYGSNCVIRAYEYMMSIDDFMFSTFSQDDINCACAGICIPPLPPNPDAAAWFQSFTKTRAQANLPQAIKNNAVYIALTAIIVAVGLFGNGMALFSAVVWLPRNITNICMASQCISDFIIVAFGPILRLINQLYGQWYSGQAGCMAVYAIRDMCFLASSMTMAYVGIERFIAICYPLKAKSISSNSKTIKILIGVWICAIGIGVWRAFNVLYVATISICFTVPQRNSETAAFFSLRWISVFFVPLIVLAVCYTCVCKSLFASLAQVRKLKNSGNSGSSDTAATNQVNVAPDNAAGSSTTGAPKKKEDIEKEERAINRRLKVIRLLMSMVGLFFACWGPIITVEAYIGITGSLISSDTNVLSSLYLLSFANSAINPILYGLLAEPVRICYERIILCYTCRTNVKLDLPGVEMTVAPTRHIRANAPQAATNASSTAAGRA